MTIQQLRYIVALDNHRNFVRASESCHVAQPTLTLQVKKLEYQISLTLFDRSTQPLKPTPTGEKFIQKAREILGEIEQLRALVNDERNSMEGTFSIGVIPTLAPYLLPLFVKEFLTDFPKTKLQIQELQSEEIIEQLEKEQLDMGLLATPLNEKNIVETPIFYEPFLVYTDDVEKIRNGKDRISTDDLKPEGIWLLGKGHCFRNQTLKFCEFDTLEFERNLIMEGGSIETLKPMIKKVSGYTLIPELSYKESTDKKSIIRFREPQPVREISIVTHKNFIRERLVMELRKSILSNTPDSFRKNTRFVKVNWR
ncbi:LysR substrate-binding domain-containing protein [Flagellimonas sp. HMM57]|uniref:hydrogen peroxide-inducible genes activator n=1 Tax=unclassified Flagellimonas TaxID=2644544 RepID=UPI0013CFF3F5|nr:MULTISPECIES: hydrogen peroxide-inducible genes activator [unclassified Flagellimonas]UII77322.1 LysR substrate-binding domain-containing protein [Flagellimonas sp. HMM57]